MPKEQAGYHSPPCYGLLRLRRWGAGGSWPRPGAAGPGGSKAGVVDSEVATGKEALVYPPARVRAEPQTSLQPSLQALFQRNGLTVISRKLDAKGLRGEEGNPRCGRSMGVLAVSREGRLRRLCSGFEASQSAPASLPGKSASCFPLL